MCQNFTTTMRFENHYVSKSSVCILEKNNITCKITFVIGLDDAVRCWSRSVGGFRRLWGSRGFPHNWKNWDWWAKNYIRYLALTVHPPGNVVLFECYSLLFHEFDQCFLDLLSCDTRIVNGCETTNCVTLFSRCFHLLGVLFLYYFPRLFTRQGIFSLRVVLPPVRKRAACWVKMSWLCFDS